MPKLEIHPLSELRGEAAALLAERFARQRAAEPLLPEIEDFEPHVPADGLVATRVGAAVAYLADESGGDVMRPGFASHAAREPEALRDLFAVIAARSQAQAFSVAVPALDAALVDAWFRLAFGCQFVWAVRETEAAEPVDFGGTIRPSTPDDLTQIVEIARLLALLQVEAPSFGDYEVPSVETYREEWGAIWDDPDVEHFVAELDGRLVGQMLLYRRPVGDLRVPADNIDLSNASTREDVRGRGVGVALTHHVLRWAHERGYRSMTIDWRSVNLLSSRFWPRRGFRPTYLRLYRRVP